METKQKHLLKASPLIIFLCISAVMSSGCVMLNRPLPPKITGIPYIDKDFTTITVVRKKQYSTSGTIFTLAIDNKPFVQLKHDEYTTFHISPGNHKFNVVWDIAGFTLIGPFGGALGDSPHIYEKAINIQCKIGSEYFITLETKDFDAYVKKPEDGVIIKHVERLTGDFTITNKKFIVPIISKK
ncbi:MAG: hypothetical protein P8Y24_06710 [Gammaproteobacteria bacterium]